MANQANLGGFLQAVQIFNQEMTRQGVSRAIKQANEEAARIRSQELADVEKRAQLNTIAQNLQLGILGAGGAPGTAAVAGKTMEPQKPESINPTQLYLQSLSFDQQVNLGKELLESKLTGKPPTTLEGFAVQQLASQTPEEQKNITQKFLKKELKIKTPTTPFAAAIHGLEDDKLIREIGEKSIAAEEAREKADLKAKEKKELDSRLIPGIGYAKTKEDATKLKGELAEVRIVTNELNKLKELTSVFDKFNPEHKRRAKVIATALLGKLRKPLVGPGAVSEPEWAILRDVVANPTDLLEIFPEAALNQLQESITDAVKIGLKSYGVIDPDQDFELPGVNLGGITNEGVDLGLWGSAKPLTSDESKNRITPGAGNQSFGQFKKNRADWIDWE